MWLTATARLVLLATTATLTGANTCAQPNSEGSLYYGAGADQCRIYVCKNGQGVLFRDRCHTYGPTAPTTPVPPIATPNTCTGSNGRVYFDNDRWNETTATPCREYQCVRGVNVLIRAETCPRPGACTELQVIGTCCPLLISCGSSTCTTSSGAVKSEGQSWWETDAKPCHRYTCSGGLKVLQQTRTCPPADSLCESSQYTPGQCCPTQTQCKCVDGESMPPRYRYSGEQWPSSSDPCVTRVCREGVVSEVRQLPLPQPCPLQPSGDCRPVPAPPGTCQCPAFDCPQGDRSCLLDGVLHPHNDQWQIKPCVIGTCHDGSVHRAVIDCPPLPPLCVRVTQPNQCCATCGDVQAAPCEYEGRTYQHHDTWTSQCGSHVCDNGEVVWEDYRCPPPPESEARCAPVQQSGCCVRWVCDSTEYLKYCKADASRPRPTSCYRPGPRYSGCNDTGLTVPLGCCPIFHCLEGCTGDDGVIRPHGTSWLVGCTHFTCTDGKITSAVQGCPRPVNEHCRRTNPGQCCPQYTCDCDGGHPDGSTWTTGCAQHTCRHGFPEAVDVPCPPPPRPGCTPLPTAGCCPKYNCSCAAVLCAAPPTEPGCLPVGFSDDNCCTLYDCTGDCLDDQGRLHRDGSEWFVKCARYRCSGGKISQLFNDCPRPKQAGCREIFRRLDDCCPVFDCDEHDCTPGENTFDGCNHCHCTYSGILLCTRKNCTERGCWHPQGHYDHGQTFVVQRRPCVLYNCSYGVIFSSIILCPPAPGPLCMEVPVADKCCPHWDCNTGPCPANFTEITWEDDCNVCTCSSAGVVCTEHICPKPCAVQGTTYETGEIIVGNDRCEQYVCLDGVAVSVLDACKQPPDYNCQAINDTGDCCPVWQCDAVPGAGAPCTPGDIHQSDNECLYCECVLYDGPPKMLCSKMDCTKTGCWDSSDNTEHDYGSIWATPNPCRQRACVNGAITELQVKCHEPPEATCRPLRDSTRCCPTYQCGASCTDGQTWDMDCNRCYCRNGVAICTTLTCDDCVEGATWQVECNTCRCEHGRPVCTEQACPATCTEGQTTTVGCNQCICSDGALLCTKNYCPTATCTEGQATTVGCNQCICSDGALLCTKNYCPTGYCPSPVLRLLAPHRHPTDRVCSTDVDCNSVYVGCCRGKCIALSGKPGQCPPPRPTAQCPARPLYACQDDHQCPSDFKCCQVGSCSRKYCVSQAGHVLLF